MTTHMIKITESEADIVAKGRKMFVFRNSNCGVKENDTLQFRVIFKGKQRPHKIETQRFLVTHVSSDAPIEKGFSAIAFRRTV